MNHHLVRVFECSEYLQCHVDGQSDVQQFAALAVFLEKSPKRRSFEQFHREVQHPVRCGTDVVHGDNIVMAQTPGDLRFFYEEFLPSLGLQRTRVHELKGKLFVDERIVRAVHHAHSPLPNLCVDDVTIRDAGPRLKIDGFRLNGQVVGHRNADRGAAGKARARAPLDGRGHHYP